MTTDDNTSAYSMKDDDGQRMHLSGDLRNLLTKKAITSMSTETLEQNMSEMERDMIKDNPNLSHTRFLHVRRLNFVCTDGRLYMFCTCCMDDRCGTICRHKFAVYSKYLVHLGFHKFDHNSVHCINWSAYNFLANRCEHDMTQSQLDEWHKYQAMVEDRFEGTLCQHELKMTVEKLERMMVTQFGGECLLEYKGKDLLQWYTESALSRVLNFSLTYVTRCLEKYGQKHYDSINMLSQVSNVGFETGSEHAIEEINDAGQLSSLIAMESSDFLSVKEREKAFIKKMYELKGMLDFNNRTLFTSLMGDLSRLQSSYALKQRMIQREREDKNSSTDPDSCEFPNRTYGQKTKSSKE